MNELLDYVLEQLEPDDQVDVDKSSREPFEWKAKTLYGYFLPATTLDPFETGPTALERFVARFVYVADDGGEQSNREPSREVSDDVDGKRQTYLETLLAMQGAPPWIFTAAAEVPPPETLQTRSVALQLAGYRILS